MHLKRETLERIVQAQIISQSQANQILDFLEKENANTPQFSFVHFTYYFGALICITAMTWFVTLGWESFGGTGLAVISAVYGLLFFIAGRTLWSQKNLTIPGGLLITLAAFMTPLFIYGLQRATGFWIHEDPGNYRDYHRWVAGDWVLMSSATAVVSTVLIRFYRFPFLTLPIAVALWYLSMDLAPILLGLGSSHWEYRQWVSLWFGLSMILTSYFLDRRTQKDFSFWLYLFGLMAFWGGLTLMNSNSELSKLIYCFINLGLMGTALFLGRKMFMVFGSLGVIGYLSHLSYRVFKDSLLFPLVLILIGLAIIYFGVKIQKNQKKLETWMANALPKFISDLRPAQREHN